MSEAVAEAKERGFTNLLAIATSAYSSFSSCRQYREDYAAALEATGLEGELRIDKVRQFFDHPGFVMPFIKAVHDGLDELRERMPDLDVTSEVEVLFSTHSIPMADAERSGPHERHDDGTVVDVHEFDRAAPTRRSTSPSPRSSWPPPRTRTCPGSWSTSRAPARPPSPGSSRTSTTPSRSCRPAAAARC